MLDEVTRWFAARPAEDAATVAAREVVDGILLSTAQALAERLPEGEEKRRALEALMLVALRARKSFDLGRPNR